MKPSRSEGSPVPAGTWVELERVILKPGERAPEIPADTASVPFAARVRGFLLASARIGTTAEARTQAERVVSGRLRAVLPRNPAGFGDPSPELLQVGKGMKRRLQSSPQPSPVRREGDRQ
ncbi:MAG: 2-amino-4-oxopentanoate thiolase subunit OrtA [Candidatus Dormibacteraeota bacterium]|nr:2-amino-4-oxopentanoate thiolase subunit OrtA [Candidatus Dormibacteraeota bacterium]